MLVVVSALLLSLFLFPQEPSTALSAPIPGLPN